MGTRVELHMFGPGEADCLIAARRAIEAVDDALTIHRPSPATALNEALARGGSAGVDDPLLLDALAQAADAVAATGGLFDPTAAAGLAGRWGRLHLDLAAARVEADGPAAFDFGGFGKGYALDRAVDILRSGGVASAVLSAGESSIAAIGAHPLGGGWLFAIPDPAGEGELVAVEVEDAALSISSTMGRGAAAPGRAAIVRPKTGEPVARGATAVAIERRGAMAEAISTALIVADAAEAAALIASYPAGRRLYHHAAFITAAREDDV